jgi:hypothetical protein
MLLILTSGLANGTIYIRTSFVYRYLSPVVLLLTCVRLAGFNLRVNIAPSCTSTNLLISPFNQFTVILTAMLARCIGCAWLHSTTFHVTTFNHWIPVNVRRLWFCGEVWIPKLLGDIDESWFAISCGSIKPIKSVSHCQHFALRSVDALMYGKRLEQTSHMYVHHRAHVSNYLRRGISVTPAGASAIM